MSRARNLSDVGGISYITATGNKVGIGSTIPQYTLDVLGDINLTGTFRQNGSQFVTSRWTSGTGDDIYRLDGDVGIGITNPAQKLDVSGAARITNYGGASFIEIGQGQNSNQYAFIDFVGDTTYTDYGLRLIRENSGANTDSELVHRGTGSLKISTLDAGPIVFKTSGTEKARIESGGSLLVGKSTSNALAVAGFELRNNNQLFVTASAALPAAFNRLTDDGLLLAFYQDTSLEGSISVSGATVSYNGAHLSRWSQLPGGNEREEILRGTVLSNLDEMCEWGEEDNEQLNRMKVSDIEGDPNVAGVFQSWDDDDDTYTDDFYCAMTGDFIIRIAEGVVVNRGDLLMSAGDGTAKPQDDDIVRSKTVAKVTSTHVTCTYDDGSYCVPCVLMAC